MHHACPSLLAAVLAFASIDVCGECTEKTLCTSHAREQVDVIAAQKPRLKDADAQTRIGALRALALTTRTHENAPSAALAKLIAQSLADSEPEVRAVAIELLGTQHTDTAYEAFERFVDERLGEMEKTAKEAAKPLPHFKESKDIEDLDRELEVRNARIQQRKRELLAIRDVQFAMVALANRHESRNRLLAMRAYVGVRRVEPDISAGLCGPLLLFGTRDVYGEVVAALEGYEGTVAATEGVAIERLDGGGVIHRTLSGIVERTGLPKPDPAPDGKIATQWRAWFAAHADELPAE